jgi:replicative DNA helicase
MSGKRTRDDKITVTRPGWVSALVTSKNAEELLVSALVTTSKPEDVDAVRNVLNLDQIHDERCRATVEAVLALSSAGRPWDAEFVLPIVARRLDIDENGTWEWLLALYADAPTFRPANAVEYALAVGRQWQRRELLYGLQKLDNDLASADLSVRDALDATLALCERLKSGDSGARDVDGLGVVLKSMRENPTDETISTHIPPLDTALRGGLRRKQLIVVGARPSVGKSAMLGQIAIKAASAGIPVLYLSFEMSKQEMVERWAKQGPWDLDCEIDAGRLSDLPIQLRESGGWTMDRVEAETRRCVNTYGTSLVVLDYLNLLRPSNTWLKRLEHLGDVTTRLKQLAMTQDVAVLSAAQFNRAKEARDSQRPVMSDFRESGTIEQDADILIGLDRDITPGADADAMAYVMKQRGGKTADIPLTFNGERVSFQLREESYADVIDGFAGL